MRTIKGPALLIAPLASDCSPFNGRDGVGDRPGPGHKPKQRVSGQWLAHLTAPARFAASNSRRGGRSDIARRSAPTSPGKRAVGWALQVEHKAGSAGRRTSATTGRSDQRRSTGADFRQRFSAPRGTTGARPSPYLTRPAPQICQWTAHSAAGQDPVSCHSSKERDSGPRRIEERPFLNLSLPLSRARRKKAERTRGSLVDSRKGETNG